MPRTLGYLAVAAILCGGTQPAFALPSPVRASITLDDGDVVVVDSIALAWSAASQIELVKRADRSTRTTNVTSPMGGLFLPGDRVFITYKYLAWFGKGTLRGIWTLTGDSSAPGAAFKYIKTGQFAHNELIVGSAPGAQVWKWDQHAPPTEFSVALYDPQNPSDPGDDLCCAVYSHHDGGSGSANQRYTIWDGAFPGSTGEGILYGNGGRLVSANLGVVFSDTTDLNDGNGVASWYDSQVGFICAEDYIRVIWRIIPRVSVPAYPLANTYYWLWSSYSYDADGTACDDGAADDWPPAPWDEYRYARSNRSMYTDATGPHPLPAGLAANTTSALLPRGLCENTSTGFPGTNPAIYFTGAPNDQDWLQWGPNSSWSGAPSVKIRHIVDAYWGTPISWNYLVFAHEGKNDAVWGGGGVALTPSWPVGDPNVAANWRTTSFKIEIQ